VIKLSGGYTAPSAFSPSPAVGKRERAIQKIFQEIAKKYNLELKSLSNDWIFKFKNPNTGAQASVFGYKFDLNGSGATEVCNDKAGTYEVLKESNVPAIEHQLFLRDCNVGYVDDAGSMEQIYRYTERFGHNVVCKRVNGSGGKEVHHVTTKRALNDAVRTLFSQFPSICISPFKKFKYEYRVIMLYGTPQLVFKKVRPFITGDGKSTVFKLYTKWGNANLAHVKKIDLSSLPVEQILAEGEVLELGWKHNLCNGASAELLPLNSRKIEPIQQSSDVSESAFASTDKLTAIAKQAVEALGVCFCSVDIVELPDGNLEVLEVNSGVLMENFIKQYGPQGLLKAKSIYEQAVCGMLGIKVQNACDTSPVSVQRSFSTTDSEETDSPLANSPPSPSSSPFLRLPQDDVDPRSPLTPNTLNTSATSPEFTPSPFIYERPFDSPTPATPGDGISTQEAPTPSTAASPAKSFTTKTGYTPPQRPSTPSLVKKEKPMELPKQLPKQGSCALLPIPKDKN
jgi:glutathione synthase/RimK-type ligase-like ATP-grasp enzyme